MRHSRETRANSDTRWVGTGRTVLNNKGNPVKQYEPYFSVTDAFESEPELVETGVTPILHYDPLGRLVRTDLPDGSFSKVEFTPWMQTSFDPNDTVLDSQWYKDRGSPDPTFPEPTNAETRAAWLAAKHANTPSVTHFDTLGRAFYVIADNGSTGKFATRTELDIEGNESRIVDARNNPVMEYRYGIHGEKGFTRSMDAGDRYLLITVDAKPLYTWDSRSHRIHVEYDALRRPLKQWLRTNGAADVLVGQTIYGESANTPQANNLRAKPWKSFDQSGLTESVVYDFKGNLLQGNRQLAIAYKTTIDWNVTNPDSLLESEAFTTVTAFDALNRAVSIQTPHTTTGILASEVIPTYNEASLLNAVDVKLRGSTTATNFVSNIDYDAKGQRERIAYGNGATTRYTYDEKTFRLRQLLTTRNSGADSLQDLSYTYDTVGNIAQILDAAQQTLFYNGQVVSPTQKFEYDALYRLLKATGREHAQSNDTTEPELDAYGLSQSPMPSDATALRNYERKWNYDEVGNIFALIHKVNGNVDWQRDYAYANTSNRLNSTSVGQTTLTHAHNEHGSMTAMPHLQNMEWDFAEHLSHVTRGTTEAYYNYDGSGQRVRKVIEKGGITETRIYLGGFEIYRKKSGTTLNLERETLHVMDDKHRIALVETKTVDAGNVIANPVAVLRYQLDNHLGSASLELDVSANLISYEEYYPYGDTSYQAGRSSSEVSEKRYRYTGKEKDEESGLYYHGARYYACWLGRWTASDPAGLVDGVNQYGYCSANPVRLSDPSGHKGQDAKYNLPEQHVKGDTPPNAKVPAKISASKGSSGGSFQENTTASGSTYGNVKTFGSYLPGTEMGEEALEGYAQLINEGEKQGGVKGALTQAAGYTGGFFSALWTPETAIQTTVILGSAGVGSLAPAGSLLQKGLAAWGAYESSVSVTEGITGTTSGTHAMDIGSWAWSGQYQGGQEMSGLQRGASIGLGGIGALASFAGAANSSGIPLVTKEGFLLKGFQIDAPFNIPVQRFGNMRISGEDPWGLRIGQSLLANRGFAAIKAEWNPLTQYTQGSIPKGTPIKFGIIAPQSLLNFGGSLQFNAQSRNISDQTSRMIQR